MSEATLDKLAMIGLTLGAWILGGILCAALAAMFGWWKAKGGSR